MRALWPALGLLWLLLAASPALAEKATKAAGLPEADKEKLANQWNHQALVAYKARHYQQAIMLAEKVQDLRLAYNAKPLDNARKILLASHKRQKDLFDKPLIEALKKYTQGDYRGSREICQGILDRDPSSEDAQRCVKKATSRLEGGAH